MEMSREVKPESIRWSAKARVRRRLAGAGALVAILVAGAAWSYFSPWVELARLQRALTKGDAATLAGSMDMNGIREKLVIRLATEALRTAQLSPGDERVNQVVLAVEATVDVMMRPESLAKLMEQSKEGAGAGAGAGAMRVEGGYLNMGVFVFAIENKKTRGALTLRMRRMGPVSWMLDELIFLTPQQLGVVPS